MPTYSYKCSNCGHVLEAFQNISDAPLTDCPECHATALEKVLLSAPNFQLKGKGWYKTDYSKAGNAKAADTASSSKTETKTDKAPEKKTTDKSTQGEK